MEPYVQARVELIEFYQLLESAPPDVHHEFVGLSESSIHAASLQAEKRILRGDFGLRVAHGAGQLEVIIDIAAQLRALDRHVAQLSSSFGPSGRPMTDWRVKTSSDERFLIPRYARAVPRQGVFRKRALVHHRILPTQIGEYSVELRVRDGSFSAEIPALKAGGTLFHELVFTEAEFDAGFIVTGVSSEAHHARIEENLDSAAADECDIVLFPELTICPTDRELIQRHIRDGILKWESPIGLVVAGSWHEKRGDHYINVATVMDSKGNIIAEHEKLFRYWDRGEGKMEAIRPGQSITVLVRDDALVAFGICRDFSERANPNPNPYTELPVDLYLVVSTGNRSTMAGHIRTASDVRDIHGGRTIVLQQAYFNKVGETELGYMIGPSDPLNPPETNFAKSETWIRRP